jgi:ketosteroid isomerase-like protein
MKASAKTEAGPVAWVAADGLGRGTAGGQEFAFPFRMTAVLEQRDGQWYITKRLRNSQFPRNFSANWMKSLA